MEKKMILQQILNKGFVKNSDIICEHCSKTEEQLDGKPFLVYVRGLMLCGKCAIDILTPKKCLKCLTINLSNSKFCMECGGAF